MGGKEEVGGGGKEELGGVEGTGTGAHCMHAVVVYELRYRTPSMAALLG